jgi:hypothetical protein
MTPYADAARIRPMQEAEKLPQVISPSSQPGQAPTSRWYDNRLEAAMWILLVALLLGFFPYVLRRLTNNDGCDFWLFYDSSRYVLDYGLRAPKSKFLHYLPSVDVAFAGLVWLPLKWAAVAWWALMTSAWLFLLAAVRRYLLCDYDATQARRAVLCAALLVTPLFLDHLCVGAFHVLMVWFMVAGLGRISRNKPWSGGMVLGLAVWVKLLPLAAVGYLILKRKWLPAAVTLATALLVDLALSLAAFGPEVAWQLHTQWWESEALGTRNQLLTDTKPLDDDRITNQSLLVVMRRTLTHMGHGSAADYYKAQHLTPKQSKELGIKVKPSWVGSVKYGLPRPNVSVADLSPEQLQVAYTAVMLLLAALVAIYCRRPGGVLVPRQWSTEIALIVLATLWFSPLVWSYHGTATLPALALIFTRAPRNSKLAIAVAVIWGISLVLMRSPEARSLGVTLWTNLSLGVFLVWTGHGEAPSLAAEREMATAAG